MNKYRVHMKMAIWTVIDVEAADPNDALEAAYESDQMPGTMAFNSFTNARGAAMVDEGEWEAVEVTDQNGNTVWEEDDHIVEPGEGI